MNLTLKQSMSEQGFIFTVGNITGEGVTLVDGEYNVIQLPKSLLPVGTVPGSIIQMTLRRDVEMQNKEEQKINALIQKLEGGEHIGDTIITIEEDSEKSERSEVKQKYQQKVEEGPEVKPTVRVAQQVKAQQKPQTGMKKKPTKYQTQEHEPSKEEKQSHEPAQQKQKLALRQKSASRRTSSAMKKTKHQSTQTSS